MAGIRSPSGATILIIKVMQRVSGIAAPFGVSTHYQRMGNAS